MNDEQLMQIAIEAAKKSGEKYKHSIGAVLVKDGKVLATGLSHNQIFHAELNVIHAEIERSGEMNLQGYTLYSTQEPCMMCIGACLYANIDRVVFGAYASDLTETNTYEYPDYSAEKIVENAVKFDGKLIKITGGILRKECAQLMADHVYWTKP